jgi:hypothetical protein
MRFGARQASTQLAFFTGLCTTGRATNRQGQFLFGRHISIMHRYSPTKWSIVTSSIQHDVGILGYMANIKFVVKVTHGGTRAPAYVQRIDRIPVQMTTDRKLALMMGKFTAEDAAKSLQNSRCTPELVPVEITA